jgi:hypothetical protein
MFVTDALGSLASATFSLTLIPPPGEPAYRCFRPIGTPVHGVASISALTPAQGAARPSVGAAARFVTIAPVTITGGGFHARGGYSRVTSVMFSGIRAVFTIDSLSQITAIPPIGVTTGPVTIVRSDQGNAKTREWPSRASKQSLYTVSGS